MRSVFFALTLFFSLLAVGKALPAGYTFDPDHEISAEPQQLVLTETPQELTGPTFNEKVFNHELSQEFIFNYEQQFGRTEQEENFYLANRQGYISNGGVYNATQEDTARQAFAQYMAKKLLEYHSDKIMKGDPQLQKVYALKSGLSNVNMSVGPGTKLDMTYDIATGNIRGQFTTIPVNTIVLVTPGEVNAYFQKNFTPRISAETGCLVNARTFRASVFDNVTDVLSLNFTQTLAVTQDFSGVDGGRESLSMAGLKIIF